MPWPSASRQTALQREADVQRVNGMLLQADTHLYREQWAEAHARNQARWTGWPRRRGTDRALPRDRIAEQRTLIGRQVARWNAICWAGGEGHCDCTILPRTTPRKPATPWPRWPTTIVAPPRCGHRAATRRGSGLRTWSAEVR
ncbi:MAG: hypothetical protein R2854_07255 [Caldilineaceae bacterium]